MANRIVVVEVNHWNLNVPGHLLARAEADYHIAPHEMMVIGERRDLDRRQIGMIKAKYRTFMEWFASLEDAGQRRVLEYLERRENPKGLDQNEVAPYIAVSVSLVHHP